jgi:hypothetical protein
MKASTCISSLTFAILMFAAVEANSQATATGYAGVSIVEAATATSSPITSFEIKHDAASFSDISTGNVTSTSELNLGEITIQSTSAVACNMVLNPTTLFDANGNDLHVTLSASTSENQKNMCTKGTETIHMNGTAQINQNQTSGLYSGSYTLIFAFN